MSCWRKYTSDVLHDIDIDFLKEACKNMGYDLDDNPGTVSSDFNETKVDVDAVLIGKDGLELPLGFKFNHDKDNRLTIEGDFWYTGMDESKFISDLSQEYMKLSLTYQLGTNLGMTIESCEKNENGQIVIEAYAC